MSVLNRVRDLGVLDNDKLLLTLSVDLRERTKEEQRARFSGDHTSGWFYLHANGEKVPDRVMECVTNAMGETVSTLYAAHPIFESPSELARVRRQLCEEIGKKVGLSPESVGVFDPSRQRMVGLGDLATGQLIDLLQEQDRGGIVAAESNSYGLTKAEEGKVATPKGELVREKLENVDVLTVQEDGTVKAVRLDD